MVQGVRRKCRAKAGFCQGFLGEWQNFKAPVTRKWDSLLALAEVGVSVPAQASRRQYGRFHVGTRQLKSNAGPMPTRPSPMKAPAVIPAFAECHDVETIERFLSRIVV